MATLKVFLFVTYIAGICSASHRDPTEPRFVMIPDSSGKTHFVDLDDETSTVKFEPNADIEYYLYTRKVMNPVRIFKDDNAGISASSFDAKNPVKFIIHGWTGSAHNGMNSLLAKSLLAKMEANVFTIDWSKGSSGGYGESVRNVQPAGESIGSFLDWMNVLGVSFTDMHVLGHSLGGQLAGFCSRLAKRGFVEYVTAMDPAGPSWGASTNRISKNDAKYVEVIHTNSGQLGMKDAVGHNDFYPNDGVRMPGCSGNLSCSHDRAWEYVAESIEHDEYIGKLCPTVAEVMTQECKYLNQQLNMGGVRTKPAYGIFGLKTNPQIPFFQGIQQKNNYIV